MNKMRNHFLYIVCLLLLVSCTSTPKEEDKVSTEDVTWVQLTDEQVQKGGIDVGHPVMDYVAVPLIVHGRVEALPEAKQNITFPLRARVANIAVKLGQEVKQGQTLLVVEDLGIIELQQNYLTTLSDWQFAQQELDRQKEMSVNNATSKRNEQQAQANFDRLTALIRSYKEQLTMIGINSNGLSAQNIRKSVTISSPMNGVVTALNVAKGAFFDSNQQLIELLDLKKTETHVQVFQSDLQSISINDKTVATLSDVELKGRVVRIVPSLDQNNAATVVVEWDDPANLYVGVGFKLAIEQKEIELMTLPSESVLNWNRKNYVFVQSEANRYELVEVEKLQENGTRVGVKGAISLSDKVVIKNAYTLLMAMKNQEKED